MKQWFPFMVVVALALVVWWLISKGGLDFVMVMLLVVLVMVGICYLVKWVS